MSMLSTERMREMELLDAAGVRLGSVKDLLLDPQTGRVRYAVIAIGHTGIAGALGIGGRLVAIPYSVLRLDSGQLVLQRNASIIAGAPSFPPSQPPDFDRTYESQLSKYWGVPAYWEAEAADVNVLTAGELLEPSAPAVSATARLPEIAAALVTQRAEAIRVIDDQGRFLGVVTLRAIGAVIGGLNAGAPNAPDQTPTERRPLVLEHEVPTPGVIAKDAVPAHAEPERAAATSATDVAPIRTTASGTAMGAPARASASAQSNAQPVGEAPSAPSTVARSASGRPSRTAACPKCGAANRVDAGFCSGCGAPLR